MNGSTQKAIQRCRYLIVGGGTWGLAIAYKLAKRGYAGIKVLDGQDFPPSIAAGNDLNKIMEEPEELPSDNDEDDVTHAWRVIESTATNVWKTDPIYQPHYHPTGFIYAAAEKAGYEKVQESVKAHPENWTKLSNAASHEIKFCDEHPGYINLIKTHRGERSVPFAKEQIPIEASQRMRTFLHETMAHLADRRFTHARICWDADTPNRLFLIGQHPEYESLTVAVGGSGHGFMCSPAVGVIVADLLEGTLDERLKRTLGWRPATAVGRDWWDTQGRFGADGRVMGLEGSEGWTGFGD